MSLDAPPFPGTRSQSIRARLLFALALVTILVFGLVAGRVAFGFPWDAPIGGHLVHPGATATATTTGANQIVEENSLPGTTDWLVPPNMAATTEIQAYAAALSVAPGQTQTFYVSTQHEGTPYTLAIYRLGWYGGKGGRLLASTQQIGHAQGYFDAAVRGPNGLIGCRSCLVDRSTGLVEANWQPSYTRPVPPDWVTGVYLAQFTEAGGRQTWLTFDVRGNPSSTYVAVTSDTTLAAYNRWGGYSLYQGPDRTITTRAYKVSFERPFTGQPARGGLMFEIDAIRWLERQGYDLSYLSSVDLHEHPEQLLNHRAYLSLGHDEYWSRPMRDGVEHARNSGIGLAFLGANVGFWQARFEPDHAGARDRTLVCYKEAYRDPLYGINNALVTVEWRSTLLHRPENALVGIMYSGYTTYDRSGFPWRVSTTSGIPLLMGTDLQPGQTYGCDLVGYEWDRMYANGATPPGLHVLSRSPTIDLAKGTDFSNTAYYLAQSGAFVFAAGSLQWTYGLDEMRLLPATRCAGRNTAVPGMQELMAHVMQALATRYSDLD